MSRDLTVFGGNDLLQNLLCDDCKRVSEYLNSQPGTDPSRFFRFKSYKNICLSAEACVLCLLLLKGLRRTRLTKSTWSPRELSKLLDSQEMDAAIDHAIDEQLLGSRKEALNLRVVRPVVYWNNEGHRKNQGHLKCEFEEFDSGPRCLLGVFPLAERARSFCDDPRGHVSLQDNAKIILARKWYAESLRMHRAAAWEQKKTHDSASPLPTRLLDLGHPCKGLTASLRLVSSKNLTGRYLTLSYRWGSSHHFVTTRDNIASYRESILFDALPSTFQDAVIVTRLFEFRYLWIDALCIIQDDEEDWLAESSRMCNVYRNASFTIAVHSARHSDHGFLKTALTAPSVILGARDSMERAVIVNLESNFITQVDYSLLSCRGWVLQERYISERILHFCDFQIFWEDQFGTCAEDCDDCQNNSRYSYPLKKTVSFRLEDVVNSPQLWYKLVEKYSMCGLTFEKDKLPAIAGLVNYIQGHQSRNGQYYAGIWSKSLHYGLLWVGKDCKLRRPVVPRAASWSWASMDGPIQFLVDIDKLTSAFEVIHVEESAEMLGMELLQGFWSLKLKGPLFRLHSLHDLQIEERLSPHYLNFDFNITARELNFSKRNGVLCRGFISFDDDSEIIATQGLWCADIAYLNPLGGRINYTLLLTRNEIFPSSFRRVGMGQFICLKPGDSFDESPTMIYTIQ